MKRYIYILFSLWLCSCTSDIISEPYSNSELSQLSIVVYYPTDYADYNLEGQNLTITSVDNGNSYSLPLDALGSASIKLTNGCYLVQYSAKHDDQVFNATADQVLLADKDLELKLNTVRSVSGALVFKEIYCGGCLKLPTEGTYQYDKYVIIHNNSGEVAYLDGLCYGILDPYNSQATNIWNTSDPVTGETIYPDELYLVQAIWQFGGDGTSFPLLPGEDAVICNLGAIDHRSQYPLSVNLNKEGYFVLYDNVLFPNTYYHPAPGDNISPDRYLDVAIKLGVANAWTLSVYSPAPVIFRPEGTTLSEHLLQDDNVFWKPGSNYDQIARIPIEWVLDGVDVFYGGSSNNKKRFNTEVDAGYVLHSALYDGKSLHRKVDTEASAAAGYEILVDTNNSNNDFYERDEASLRDE